MPEPSNHACVQLAQELIRCPSVTPLDAGALSLLANRLSQAGFAIELVTFCEPGTPDVKNLYARYGKKEPCFLFAGHTDVVPSGDVSLWRHNPFAGIIEDDKLYGRGACDMKGGVAAMVTAALDFVKEHPDFNGSIAFLLTGDEEGPAINGTIKLLEWAKERGESFSHCVLGEPTNPEQLGDMIKIGRRGSLTGHLLVQGKQGHVGYPHLAKNPVPTLLRALAALLSPAFDKGTKHFSPSNLEVTTIDINNPVTNVIPDKASAVFNVRFNDSWTLDSLQAEIKRRLAQARQEDDAEIMLDFRPSNSVAFLTDPGPFVELVRNVVQEQTGKLPQLSTSGGTSDARFIQAYCPVIEFGPVGSSMHQVDEYVSIDDLAKLTMIYKRILTQYFA